MLYNKAPIMWKSKMQKTTALSTAEAEYYAASTAASKVLYLYKLLKHMGFVQASPTPVSEDNTACIEWGNNVIGGRERAKHIDIRKRFAHEVIHNGEMLLVRVPMASHADIFTKGLHYPQWQACVEGILGKRQTVLRDLRPQELMDCRKLRRAQEIAKYADCSALSIYLPIKIKLLI